MVYDLLTKTTKMAVLEIRENALIYDEFLTEKWQMDNVETWTI